MDDQAGAPSIKSAARRRRAPRWVIPFLRALERTGEVRSAAKDAGVDFSTAYARRKAHREFAAEWETALAAFKTETFGAGPHSEPAVPVHPRRLPGGGREVISQQLRAGADRWTPRRERRFFEELAATANIRRAAEAAGVSTQAVYARRAKRPDFRARWAQALENGRAAIEMKLVAEANRSLDPETMDLPEAEPKVSVAEAIRIVKLHGSAKQQAEFDDPFAEQAASMTEEDAHELREKLVRKLRRLRDRDMPDWIAQGWSFDEEADHMVPPGWVRVG